MKLNFITYGKRDGIPNFTNSEILKLYDMMESDGVVDTVFRDGTIRSREDFLQSVVSGYNLLYLVTAGDNPEPAFVCWLNNLNGKMAMMHWSCFSRFWGDCSDDVGKFAIDKLIHMKDMEGRYILDVLIGLIPISNERAIDFSQRVGGTLAAVVPHAAYHAEIDETIDAVLVHYTREA
jgi:hypothetical protein